MFEPHISGIGGGGFVSQKKLYLVDFQLLTRNMRRKTMLFNNPHFIP